MGERFRVDPDGIYDDAALVLGLGVTHATLATARRNGDLRAARKGRKTLYRGQWILDWLENQTTSNRTSEKAVQHD